MITQIHLDNFQAHEYRRINLSPGLNVIIGPTDTGKSAIVRAIRFVALHEPITGLMTHGKKTLRVTLNTESHRVVRFKDRDYGYTLDGGEYLACAKTQPADITKALNLNATNFQCQHDPHFLLSLTPGQAAKEINKIVALEDIDKALGWLKEQAKNTGARLKAAEAESAGLQDELDQFVDIHKLEGIVSSLQSELTAIESQNKDSVSLSLLVDQILALRKSYSALLRKQEAATACREAAEAAYALESRRMALESIVREASTIDALPRLEAAAAVLEGIVSASRSFDRLALDILELEDLRLQIFEKNLELRKTLRSGSCIITALEDQTSELATEIYDYEELTNTIKKLTLEQESLETRLAKLAVCPACGKLI